MAKDYDDSILKINRKGITDESVNVIRPYALIELISIVYDVFKDTTPCGAFGPKGVDPFYLYKGDVVNRLRGNIPEHIVEYICAYVERAMTPSMERLGVYGEYSYVPSLMIIADLCEIYRIVQDNPGLRKEEVIRNLKDYIAEEIRTNYVDTPHEDKAVINALLGKTDPQGILYFKLRREMWNTVLTLSDTVRLFDIDGSNRYYVANYPVEFYDAYCHPNGQFKSTDVL